jgi:hypothetical protein
MRSIKSSLLTSIIKSNILISKINNKNLLLNYTKTLNEIKQLVYLLHYCVKNKVPFYIICENKQQKFIFDKFLTIKNVLVVTDQVALTITDAFFIIVGKVLSKQIINKLTKKNNIIFLINILDLKKKNYQLKLYLDTYNKFLFLSLLIKNILEK